MAGCQPLTKLNVFNVQNHGYRLFARQYGQAAPCESERRDRKICCTEKHYGGPFCHRGGQRSEIMSIMGKCLERGILLYTTKEGYTFDNTINSKVLCFAFGLVAEIERNLISMRTKEALALRKAEGIKLGRRYGSYTKTNILRSHRAEVVSMLENGDSIAAICRHFGVSRETFSRFRTDFPDVDAAVRSTPYFRKKKKL